MVSLLPVPALLKRISAPPKFALPPVQGFEEIDRGLDAAERLVMRNQGVKLGFGFGTKGNHPLGEGGVLGFSSAACIRAMVERSRSSTGSNGTVCPAAICASLRASLAAIDSGTGLSGDV